MIKICQLILSESVVSLSTIDFSFAVISRQKSTSAFINLSNTDKKTLEDVLQFITYSGCKPWIISWATVKQKSCNH